MQPTHPRHSGEPPEHQSSPAVSGFPGPAHHHGYDQTDAPDEPEHGPASALLPPRRRAWAEEPTTPPLAAEPEHAAPDASAEPPALPAPEPLDSPYVSAEPAVQPSPFADPVAGPGAGPGAGPVAGPGAGPVAGNPLIPDAWATADPWPAAFGGQSAPEEVPPTAGGAWGSRPGDLAALGPQPAMGAGWSSPSVPPPAWPGPNAATPEAEPSDTAEAPTAAPPEAEPSDTAEAAAGGEPGEDAPTTEPEPPEAVADTAQAAAIGDPTDVPAGHAAVDDEQTTEPEAIDTDGASESVPQVMVVRADLDEHGKDAQPDVERTGAAQPEEPAAEATMPTQAEPQAEPEPEAEPQADPESAETQPADAFGDADDLTTATAAVETGAGEDEAVGVPVDAPPTVTNDQPEPAAVPAAPLRPGDVAETAITVWSADAARQLRDEWQVVAARFVDEPEGALTQAQALVTGAVQRLAESLLAEQADLDPRRAAPQPDTEAMRVAMRRYRDFLDRVLAL